VGHLGDSTLSISCCILLIFKLEDAMKNGLYKASYETMLGAGSAVIHAIDGKLWGGDAGLYYVGSYVDDGSKISAKLRTDRHTVHPGLTSVFGLDRVNITLVGTTSGDTIQCTGTAAEAPGVNFTAVLKWLSD
jgi:hypothetical protein